MRCGIISSCQLAPEHVFVMEQRYIKYQTFLPLPLPTPLFKKQKKSTYNQTSQFMVSTLSSQSYAAYF